jgi:RsiW-degrading membrane proteinase PrsW (M82 family)
VTQAPLYPPAGWYADPHEITQLRWWNGDGWTAHVAVAHGADTQQLERSVVDSTDPGAPVRRKHPGVIGGLIIFVSSLALWIYSACAELFWLGMHGTRIVIVMFAAAPTAAAMLYVMCRRLRPMDKIAPSFVLIVAILGGFAALIIPALTEPAWGRLTTVVLNAPLLSPAIAGPLEEACKLAVVAFAARWVTVRNARTGLFIGGAVGFGYSIFENIDYALSAAGGVIGSPADHFGLMLHDVIVREALGAFGHPIWTALTAAALFAAAKGGKLRITPLVVLAYLAAAAGHTLWDEGPAFIFHFVGPSILLEYAWYILLAVANFFVWRAVCIRANRSAFADAALLNVV